MMVLLVEDDASLRTSIQGALHARGFGVRAAGGTREALVLLDDQVDVVVLDLSLPDGDGLELLQSIRRAGDAVVLAASGRASLRDRIHGLNCGADDYLAKPYHIGELIARLHALSRRLERSAHGPVAAGGSGGSRMHLDHAERTVTLRGHRVRLTRKEFEILAVLSASPGVVFHREHLLSTVWRSSWPGDERTLTVHVASLRSKLGDPGLIETVRGVGYRLVL